MRILDLTAGNRAIWFNKSHPDAIYLDIRASVNPDRVADARQLPMDLPNDFDLVVFDPPHLNFGANSNMSRDYGHYTTIEILDLVSRGSFEAARRTKADGLMALKWNDHSIKLERVFACMPEWEPLFGHGVATSQRRNKSTQWVMLKRKYSGTQVIWECKKCFSYGTTSEHKTCPACGTETTPKVTNAKE